MDRIANRRIVNSFNNDKCDLDAFKVIYDQFYSIIFIISEKLLKNSEDAEDITCDSFYKLMRSKGKFESLERIGEYLRSTAKNGCLDFLKHKKVIENRRAEVLEKFLSESQEPLDDNEIKTLLLHKIHMAIKKLPRRSRDIYSLRYVEGMKIRDIAKYLNISSKTVDFHIQKILKRLRNIPSN
jgi:RNA polymerase sigma-70 factor (family 1)